MPKLTIALEEGFASVHVVVSVNGEVRFERADVTTRLQIGLADTVEIDVDEGPATVQLSLPDEGRSNRIDLRIEGDTYIGFSVEADRITHRVSDRPFGYA